MRWIVFRNDTEFGPMVLLYHDKDERMGWLYKLCPGDLHPRDGRATGHEPITARELCAMHKLLKEKTNAEKIST